MITPEGAFDFDELLQRHAPLLVREYDTGISYLLVKITCQANRNGLSTVSEGSEQLGVEMSGCCNVQYEVNSLLSVQRKSDGLVLGIHLLRTFIFQCKRDWLPASVGNRENGVVVLGEIHES